MRMRSILLLTLALILLTFPALAEDVCTIDATEASACTTDRSYLRVACPLSGEQPVTLTVSDSWGYLVYQRDYGLCSGTFYSEDVYLDLYGTDTAYTVTLRAGSETHTFRVTREAPLMTDSGVCAHGLPLDALTGRSSNKSAMILDVYALEGSTLSMPLVSEGLLLGYASCTVEDGQVTVSADLTVDGTIDRSGVYVARDAVTARTLGTNRYTGKKYKLGRRIDLMGTPYAAVLVQLTVSYDPETALPFQEDADFLDVQQDLWELMQLTTANEAVG